MKKRINYFKYVISAIIIILAFVTSFIVFSKKEEIKKYFFEEVEDSDFTINLIKKTYKEGNYLISPYSIKVALNMLKEGASGDTRQEIEKVLENTEINQISSAKVANAVFIKDMYKDVIETPFITTLSSKYYAEVIYDEFYSPYLINEWTKEKTDGMIEKVIDEISPDFVLGLINAIAVDTKWKNQFVCSDTYSEEFTTASGNVINVGMMHNTYQGNAKYLVQNNLKGVILPYEDNLEFIALMPDDLDKFIGGLSKKKVDNIINSFKDASESERLLLSLPRFSYSYDLEDFTKILKEIGVKKAFSLFEADFSNIITKENLELMESENLYVNKAVHKTFIDLNEEGTRAAAVTYFGFDKSSAIIEKDYEEINIKFDKPFFYIIRDKETNEMLFFGRVNEPSVYKGSTCTTR